MPKFQYASLLAAVTVALAGPVLAADITGPWLVHAEWGGKFKYDMICGLTQKGSAVTGPCMVIGVRPESASGTWQGDAIEFEYVTSFQGNDVDVHFDGTMDGLGQVKGPVHALLSSGGFAGRLLGEKGPVSSFKLHVGLGSFDYQMICAFKTNGKSLRGPCAGGDGNVLNATGTSDDKGVSFAYDTSLAGHDLHVTYSGTVQPDGSIKGTATDGTNVGAFTAKKK